LYRETDPVLLIFKLPQMAVNAGCKSSRAGHRRNGEKEQNCCCLLLIYSREESELHLATKRSDNI